MNIFVQVKKNPAKVYVWEKTPMEFPGCQVLDCGNGQKIVFGDWKNIAPVLDNNEFAHVEIENNCRNSAIPMLDIKISPPALSRLPCKDH